MDHPSPQPGPDAALFEALRARIRPPGVPFVYTVGLALVAGAMVLLPLCYLALVGAAGYGVYWHATEHLAWFAHRTGGIRLGFLKLLAYLGLLIAGLIIVFFLLKPLFARRPKGAQPLALNPGAEPRLYAAIEALAKAVGAPPPRRIDLDARLNASAGFRRGYLSFLGGDLVLTLGLPLIANLTVAELAGVVAHEFGHFTQGMAMRLAYVIDRINGWFARVVFERDAWDQWLSELGDQPEDWRVALCVWMAQAGIGLSRLALRLLMNVGVALSAFLSRQMEFHADACHLRIVGSECFERTHHKLATLVAASQQTRKMLVTGWNQSGKLPDNLPELVRRVHDDLPDSVVNEIRDTLGLGQTQWYDTHPCPAERIRCARRAANPGILDDDRPASALFENFDIPARQVTELHYTDDLGLSVSADAILPLAPHDPGPASAAPSTPSHRAHRELVPPPVDESLLLGAPAILLPLSLPPVDLASLAEDTEAPDPAEWSELIASLESIRPRLAELNAEAISIQSATEPDGPETPPDPPSERLTHLRHAVREVLDATARRLNLGLLQAAADLETHRARNAQELHKWLGAAEDEFPLWLDLKSDLPHLITQVSQAALQGEIDATLQARIDHARSRRDRLRLLPIVPGPESSSPRKLRIGPLADVLRELEALQREVSSRFASYRHALSELWAIAGAEELRAGFSSQSRNPGSGRESQG